MKLELKKNDEARRDLHGTIKETTNEMKSEINQIHTNYTRIINEKNDYIDKLKSYELKYIFNKFFKKMKMIIRRFYFNVNEIDSLIIS